MRGYGVAPLAAFVALVALHIPSAQAPQLGGSLRFDVVSVRPNATGDTRSPMRVQPGGRFVATNVTLQQLILQAYQIQPFQLTGGPAWILTDRFDVIATASADVPEPTPWANGPVPVMMQALLGDRFTLLVRREPRQMPAYALVLARADGRLGPGLQRATVDCASLSIAARTPGGSPMPPPLSNGRPVCGNRINAGRIAGGGMPLSILTLALQTLATTGRPVIDRTGLSGTFDFDLTFTPMPPAAAANTDTPLPDATGASIFTAIQEQLGLKLEAQQGAVDVLVVERAERPKPD